MKASFRAEAMGFQPHEERTYRGLGIAQDMARRQRPWVAELTGLCPNYGFQRRFLRPKRDYADANSRGTRGVLFYWTLESGFLYETRYRSTWDRWHHRFLLVTSDGEIQDVTEEEVRGWLANVVSE